MGYGPTYGTYDIDATGTTNVAGVAYSISKDPSQNSTTVTVSGTYTGLVFTLEATCGGGDWFPIEAINNSTGVIITGATSITPGSNAEASYTIPNAVNFTAVRTNVSGYSTGTPTIRAFSTTGNVMPSVTVVSTTGAFTNITVSGTATITGDLTESGNAAITGTLAVTGASTLTGDLTESGNLAVTGTSGFTGLVTAATMHTTGAVNMAADVSITQGADLNFVGTTGQSVIHFPDNLASALVIGEAANAYITFVSTDSSEAINFSKPTRLPAPTTVVVGGTAIGNANAVTEGFTLVTGANNSAAIKLPPTVAGATCIIKSNTSGSTLQVFPPVNSTINAGAANAVYNMANLAQRTFVAYNTTAWFTAPETIT